ncbi:DUF3784 domain-containing protein [Bacillus salitolerans]|uniref:DUF3784 domain-containing protein n=1 Tax=Bacillus salitolerans TaxID=1437434 RepID=A0ABW4LRU5_9BACI
MYILIGIQLFIIGLFFLLGWAVKYKGNYGLLSGFSNRPKEEQEQLIQNGYPQKTGAVLIYTAVGMLLLMPLYFTPFLYAIEVQFGFMLLFLMGGFIYISKYDVPKKRKRSYIISSLMATITIGIIVTVFFIGYQNIEVEIYDDSFEINSAYGGVWNKSDITHIELLDEMPDVTWKINGFGLSTVAKGYFKVEGYGKSLLFITKEAPNIYLKVNNEHIFLNGETPEQTKVMFQDLNKIK